MRSGKNIQNDCLNYCFSFFEFFFHPKMYFSLYLSFALSPIENILNYTLKPSLVLNTMRRIYISL